MAIIKIECEVDSRIEIVDYLNDVATDVKNGHMKGVGWEIQDLEDEDDKDDEDEVGDDD